MVQIPARLNAGGHVIITRGVESVSLITDEDAGGGGGLNPQGNWGTSGTLYRPSLQGDQRFAIIGNR